MTLVACNATLGIVFALILSVLVFKEKFIWRFDFMAMLCIVTGCVTIVLNANKVEVTYTENEVIKMIFSMKAAIFIGVALSLFVFNQFVLRRLLKMLKRFESDVDWHSSDSQLSGTAPILPPREKIRQQQEAINGGVSASSISAPLLQDFVEVERPARVLIEAIHDTSYEAMARVSPETLTLKRFIKVPMVLFVWSSSVQSGICVVMLKLAGELVQSGASSNHILLIVSMILMLIVSAALQLHLVNCAMKYYDQLEAVPIYQTCLMIMWILSGLIVLDEKRYYSWPELFGFLGSIIICCIGIKLLTMKTKMVKIEERRSRRDILKT